MKIVHKLSILLLAFCSINYQLIVSQLLSITIRNSYEQYNLSIAIYLSAMGLGAIFYKTFFKDIKLNFILTETILSFLGLLLPLVIFTFSNILSEYNISLYFNYIILVIVGFLTGKEIPLIVDLAKETWGRILFYDFIGSFLAYILFGLFFYKSLNIISFAFLTACLNMVILSIYLITYINSKYKYLLLFFIIILITTIFCFQNEYVSSVENIYLKEFLK